MSCIRVTLRERGFEDIGLRGRNAASETADDSNDRWNGIDMLILKIRDAGRYSLIVMSGRVLAAEGSRYWNIFQSGEFSNPESPNPESRCLKGSGMGSKGLLRGKYTNGVDAMLSQCQTRQFHKVGKPHLVPICRPSALEFTFGRGTP